MSAHRAAIFIGVFIFAARPSFGAEQNASLAVCSVELVERNRDFGIPFNPYTFERPSVRFDRLPDSRWWAEMLVGVIVSFSLLRADDAEPMTNLALSLMKHPRLNFDIPIDDRPNRPYRLQLQVDLKRFRPSAALVLTW